MWVDVILKIDITVWEARSERYKKQMRIKGFDIKTIAS